MSSVPDTPTVSSVGELHFVFGVAPRSGTTYLGDLLALHPDCALPTGLPEDGLLKALGDLDSYIAELERYWESWPELAVPTRGEVLRAVGTGLGGMLVERSDSTVTVSKTPYPTNLHRLHDLFPGSKAVVIVRDGRSVAESMVRTWGMRLDMAAALFRDGARSILDAIPDPQNPPAHLHLVRYEDLFGDTRSVLRDVLEFLGLPSARMPEDAIADLPVRGSSTARGASGDEVHWEAIERPADFNPIDRWTSWSARQQRIFSAVADNENLKLGYGAEPIGPADRALDQLLGIRRAAVRQVRRVQTAK